MITQDLIPAQTLCTHYSIEISFVDSLSKMGLIHIQSIEQSPYIHLDQIGDLEKILRLHNELNVNLEGIDIVFNLLKKEKELRQELITLRNRLSRFENEE